MVKLPTLVMAFVLVVNGCGPTDDFAFAWHAYAPCDVIEETEPALAGAFDDDENYAGVTCDWDSVQIIDLVVQDTGSDAWMTSKDINARRVAEQLGEPEPVCGGRYELIAGNHSPDLQAEVATALLEALAC